MRRTAALSALRAFDMGVRVRLAAHIRQLPEVRHGFDARKSFYVAQKEARSVANCFIATPTKILEIARRR